VATVVAFAALVALAPDVLARSSRTRALLAAREAVVERVVDGDTLLLAGRERVRLIGVDAPEIAHRDHPHDEPSGRAARDFTRELAEGERVTLSFDPNDGPRDRYGRTLAYVTLPDGRLLNLEIIRAGWAEAYRAFGYVRKREFMAAEREARAAKRGMWATWSQSSGVCSSSMLGSTGRSSEAASPARSATVRVAMGRARSRTFGTRRSSGSVRSRTLDESAKIVRYPIFSSPR
jgi:micrococcal nuclease